MEGAVPILLDAVLQRVPGVGGLAGMVWLTEDGSVEAKPGARERPRGW